MSETAARKVSPALESAYQFLAWLVPTLDQFLRRQKFLLGDRIENTALDVLEGLVEATYTRNRGRILEAVNQASIVRRSREVRSRSQANSMWRPGAVDAARKLKPTIPLIVSTVSASTSKFAAMHRSIILPVSPLSLWKYSWKSFGVLIAEPISSTLTVPKSEVLAGMIPL